MITGNVPTTSSSNVPIPNPNSKLLTSGNYMPGATPSSFTKAPPPPKWHKLDMLVGLGVSWLAKGDYNMIIEEYENAIKEWTDLPTADLVQLWDRFGTVYLARYDYDGMINVFQRAAKMFESLNNPDKFS